MMEVLKVFCDHTNSKYTHDLFLVAPLYHRKLARLDRIIFLDVDITVQSNIAKLWHQFGTMEAAEARLGVEDGDDGGRRKCVGVGHDLSPHYLHRLATFISHNPGTELGSPGQYQVTSLGIRAVNDDSRSFQSVFRRPLRD